MSTTSTTDPTKLSFEAWIDWQEKKAWDGLLANVNPEGTAEGCVVASPSIVLPDYWYEWTRDSALVMRTVIQAYFGGRKELRPLIDGYVRGTQIMQRKETPLGGFRTGGLGEVKFHVDHEPFTGEWSRPQNDGPASRVITLARFAEHLLENGEEEFVRRVLYDSLEPTESVIKADLNHIATDWAKPGFDLWEEVNGSHFYTLLSIYTGLKLGASLAARLDDLSAASRYIAEATKINAVISTFWSEHKQIIRVSKDHQKGRASIENAHFGDNTYGKTSELDAAVLLATLHAGHGTEWEHGNEKVLATLEALMDVIRPVYPLNINRSIPAIGRYPEDEYDGTGLSLANPWYLATAAAAEVLYRAATALANRTTPLVVSTISRGHYSHWLPVVIGSVVEPSSPEMEKLASGQRAMADEFLQIVREYATEEGDLSEQFDRVSGVARGATKLTWSYAAFITAAESRRA